MSSEDHSSKCHPPDNPGGGAIHNNQSLLTREIVKSQFTAPCHLSLISNISVKTQSIEHVGGVLESSG